MPPVEALGGAVPAEGPFSGGTASPALARSDRDAREAASV